MTTTIITRVRGPRQRGRWIAATLVAPVLVLAAACGGGGDSEAQTGATDPPATASGSSGSVDTPANVMAVDGTTIDETVYGDRFEWSIGDVSVAEPSGANPSGSIDLVFDTEVYNVFVDAAAPSTAAIALQWDDPDTGDTSTTRVQADFQTVPGESTATGELRASLSPRDQETFNPDTAYLQIGQAGLSPAIVPLGDDRELVDRLPIPQDTDGWTFVVAVDPDAGSDGAPLYTTVTVTAANLLWIAPDGFRGVPDGSVVLELVYDLENEGLSQSCSTRGEGGWSLVGPDGNAVADVGVTERCVRPGQTEVGVFTAFVIPTDTVDGEYVLSHTRDGGGEEATGEITVTLTGTGSVSFRDLD